MWLVSVPGSHHFPLLYLQLGLPKFCGCLQAHLCRSATLPDGVNNLQRRSRERKLCNSVQFATPPPIKFLKVRTHSSDLDMHSFGCYLVSNVASAGL